MKSMRHSWRTLDFDDRTAMHQARRFYAICSHCQMRRCTTVLAPKWKAAYYGWGSVAWVLLGYRAPACNPIE